MIYETLLNGLTTGYLDHNHSSIESFQPQLLLNDSIREKKILSVLLTQLRACDSFIFSVAFLTTGGVAVLSNTLEELQEKGVGGIIIVSKYLNFTQPEALKRLLKFKNIELRIDTKNNLHAKCYIFKKVDHYSFIIGSSNLTDTALSKNYEFNLKIDSLKESLLANQILAEQQLIIERSEPVTLDFITKYEIEYCAIEEAKKEFDKKYQEIVNEDINPNSMQIEALQNLDHLRTKLHARKAILISATGTGKTFLSAFDVRALKARRTLFIVHRSTIASKSLCSYKKIIGTKDNYGMPITYGLFNGNHKEANKDLVFSTVQTMSREKNLKLFTEDYFDYIIIDETHRAAADTYRNILEYFKPKFLLGMTATPERTDGHDIFGLFDHNIAYEIRLHQALEAGLLTTFHYYGISDLEINGQQINEKSDFRFLINENRVNHILDKIKHYSTDSGIYRGLVFCSKVEEAIELSIQFNRNGYNSIALSGKTTENQREEAIKRLESNDQDRYQFIFTVDIFNEGIDIPKINLIVMLRATQSSIVFVQQLGRGLRKDIEKSYMTILDFIGNYDTNYLIPIALFGDTTYNKDHLRKIMSEGSSLIPGASTVEFDSISKKRIFDSINNAKLSVKKDLVNDYMMLKHKIGRIPYMTDFIIHGSRDPQLYIAEYKSYYNAVRIIEKDSDFNLNTDLINILRYFDNEINNAKRILETFILHSLLNSNYSIQLSQLQRDFKDKFNFNFTRDDISSSIRNINFEFSTIKYNQKTTIHRNTDYLTNVILYNVVFIKDNIITLTPAYQILLQDNTFKSFFNDSLTSSIMLYLEKLKKVQYRIEKGFILYEKYSRKDTFRILNALKNPIAQNVGGYLINQEKTWCPVFVNYHKDDHISATTKYDDGFIDQQTFHWMSKSNRTLSSNDVKTIKESETIGMDIFLFIKKENDEGNDFYFMGMIKPEENSFEQLKMLNDEGKNVNVVKLNFKLQNPVKETLYNYIINK